jgi:MYXO-CTERM domain-containing protein
VFVRSGSSWSEQAKLTGGVGDVDDEFGGSVALSGDTALVGANRDDIAFTDQGSAHVFVRSGSTWSEQAKLEASDGAAYGWFGSSVALSGDTALIGASDGIRNEGSAYVFVRSGGTWAEQAKLPASGYGLALSGDTALVTSDERYVFVRSGTTWTEQATLALSDGASANGLSSAVALSGDTALVGAAFETIGANPEQGSVYVFTLGLGKGLGDPCEGAAECASGSCADGVCCDTPCGNSATNDCQACSIAAGAASNGFCGSTTTANTCDDGDACTLTDQCDESGTCAGATPRDCDDQNECTIDSCDASSGCAHAPAADGTACDGGECRGGVCDAVGVAQDSDAEGGCSCRIAGAPSGRGLPRELGWLALAGLVSAVGVRRRRPT